MCNPQLVHLCLLMGVHNAPQVKYSCPTKNILYLIKPLDLITNVQEMQRTERQMTLQKYEHNSGNLKLCKTKNLVFSTNRLRGKREERDGIEAEVGNLKEI